MTVLSVWTGIAVAALVAVGVTGREAIASSRKSGASPSVTPWTASGGRLTGRAEVGFDSFEERYSIVDKDTVDAINETRARLRLGWEHGALLRDYLLIEGRALIGESNYETSGRLRLTRQIGTSLRSRLAFDGDITSRTFGDHSTFQFPNDYLRYYLHSYLQIGGIGAVSLRLADRVERLDYRQRTEFDYDYTRNTITLSADYENDFTTFATGGIRLATMSIPDSAAIEYDAFVPYLEFQSTPALRRQFLVQGSAERRRYTSSVASRSSFWAITAIANGEWALGEHVSLEVDDDFESYRYDARSDAYFDYVENRTVTLVNVYPSFDLQLAGGASYRFLSANASAEDEYREYGFVAKVDYNSGAALWISLEFEPGKRHYTAPDVSDTEPVFSDYTYNRVSLFGSWRVWDGVGLDVFLDYQPEDHERVGDDATATLFSGSLSYYF